MGIEQRVERERWLPPAADDALEAGDGTHEQALDALDGDGPDGRPGRRTPLLADGSRGSAALVAGGLPRLSPHLPVIATATWGVVTTAVGVAVLLRARDLDSTASVVELAGTTHTARLGVIEVCFGLVMVLAAATRSRVVLGAMAAALAVTGLFMLLERRRVAEELAVGTVDTWLVIATSCVLAFVLVCSGSSRP